MKFFGTSSAKIWLPLLICAPLAGFTGGFFGTGGGIILVLALACFSRGMKHETCATALAVMLPLSLLSLLIYYLRGTFDNFDLTTLPVYVFPGILGGLGGAFLLYRLKIPLIKKIFAAVVVISGVITVMNSLKG